MKNDNWITALIVTAVIAVAVTVFGIFYFIVANTPSQPKAGDFVQGSPGIIYSIATTSVFTVGTSNTLIDATSTGRTYFKISTNGTPVTCNYTRPASVTNGFVIAASSSVTMNGLSEPVIASAISCISDTGSSGTITVWANE
jgi:hypothetical protein